MLRKMCISSALILLSMNHGVAQSEPSNQDTPMVIQQKVDSIILGVLKRGELKAEDGTRITVQSFPTNKEIMTIEQYGEAAIPALTRHLAINVSPDQQKSPRERSAAIRLLGEIGSAKIVEPLKETMQSAASPLIRAEAIYAMTSAPKEYFVPVVKEGLHDTDKSVRDAAADVLKRYKQGLY